MSSHYVHALQANNYSKPAHAWAHSDVYMYDMYVPLYFSSKGCVQTRPSAHSPCLLNRSAMRW